MHLNVQMRYRAEAHVALTNISRTRTKLITHILSLIKPRRARESHQVLTRRSDRSGKLHRLSHLDILQYCFRGSKGVNRSIRIWCLFLIEVLICLTSADWSNSRCFSVELSNFVRSHRQTRLRKRQKNLNSRRIKQ
jgi:hypothetical protein